MEANQIVSAHFGRRGIEYKTRDEAIQEFHADMRKHALDPLVIRDEKEVKERIAKQIEARQRLSEARFYAFRDASERSEDIRNDLDHGRRARRFSITRDAMSGPTQDVNVFDLNAGRLNQRSVGGTGHDRKRFMREADSLRLAGVLGNAALPAWDSDDSIFAFFCKVYDMALEEARNPARRGQLNRVIDNAPGIFLFTELLKRSEKLIEEDFTKLWARSIFPIMDLNTWLPQWMYERMDDRAVFPTMVDTEWLPSSAPRGSENRAAVPRPLVFWHHAASWSNIELMRYAEAVANGAPNVKLDQRRINKAIHMMDWLEDIFAFFGNDDLDIHGLLSAEAKTGIERVPSGGGFQSGADTEEDRALLTREVKSILSNTEQALAPNTLMLPTDAWLYVNDMSYGSAANPSESTILERAEKSLRKFGIQDVMWVPELGYSATQKARLMDHGVPDAEAQRLAGGLSGDNCMVVMRRDPEVVEMVVAKNRTMYPAKETVNDRVEVRMLQGGGGMVFYKPEAIKIVTDVGPNPSE